MLEQAQDTEIQHAQERRRVEDQRVARLILERYFEWPSTDAPASKYGFVGDVFFYEEGLLRYVGDKVGREAVPTRVRLQILDCVFHNVLPRVQSPAYMEE